MNKSTVYSEKFYVGKKLIVNSNFKIRNNNFMKFNKTESPVLQNIASLSQK